MVINRKDEATRRSSPPSTHYSLLFPDLSLQGVDITTDDTFNLGKDVSWSLTCWVRITNEIRELIVNRRDSTKGYVLQIQATGQPDFFVNDGVNRSLIATQSIKDGKWHHIACCNDAVAGQRYIYVDGVIGNSEAHNNDWSESGALLTIDGGASSTALNGKVHGLKFYNICLSAANLLRIMKQQEEFEGNLIESWDFREGTGSVLGARINSDFDGTIDGSVVWSSDVPIAIRKEGDRTRSTDPLSSFDIGF